MADVKRNRGASVSGMLQNLPKADLHVHLNGCVASQTFAQLLRSHGECIDENFSAVNLCVPSPVSGLKEYLQPWSYFKQLPVSKSCLDAMVLSALQVLAGDNVRYAELRNSPFNIAYLNNISLQEAVDWLADSELRASSSTGVNARLILSLTRHELEEEHANTLLDAIGNSQFGRTIVGVDLSGNEEIPHSQQLVQFFRDAREKYGLGISIHAGETGNAENIRWAIEDCHAQRIGHGLAAHNNPQLLDLIERNAVCTEICLISNVRSGQIKDVADHVVGDLISRRLPFVLCSDNPQVHCASLSSDYELFEKTFGSGHAATDFTYQMQFAFTKP
jgi:adenosine deaminase